MYKPLGKHPPSAGANNRDAWPTLIRSLLIPCAYPHPVSNIELIETHISWVVLTGPFAYKIKKPVVLDFLDFSTLPRRRYYCEEELRLNRKWAPELYLDVVPICGSDENPSIGGDTNVIEYALKMAQFPQHARLDEQLDAGLLNDDDMHELAEAIAGYHDDANSLDYVSDEDSIQRVRSPMLDNFSPVRPHVNGELLQRIQDWTEKSLRQLEPALIDRQKNGFVRECHGDLHLANLVRLSSGIAAFDCVEFSAELRNIDVLSDVAFLVMDLTGRTRQDLAYVFTNRYLECTGDYAGMALFGLYFVYHCMIRAKVASLRCTERTDVAGRRRDRKEINHYCFVALKWIEGRAPLLIAMHGYSGSGKTWLSSRLMSRLPAIRVRSDIERKRLYEINETEGSRSIVGQGIYTNRARSDLYVLLFDIAARLLECEYNVILDASFLRQEDRSSVQALALRLGIPFVFVDTSANRGELLRRVKRRQRNSSDASEADALVLQHQFENSEPLDVAERRETVAVSTDTDVNMDEIIKRLTRVPK